MYKILQLTDILAQIWSKSINMIICGTMKSSLKKRLNLLMNGDGVGVLPFQFNKWIIKHKKITPQPWEKL